MEAGIFDMTREAYDQIDAVNMSLLLAGPTMAHRREYQLHGMEPSSAMEFGVALHMFILEPEKFQNHYMIYDVPPDRRTTWGKCYWNAVAKEAGEKAMLEQLKAASSEWDVLADKVGAERMLDINEVQTFKAMRDSLHKSARRRALAVAPGRYEVVIVWQDKETGLWCKGMLDKLIEKIDTVVDLKRAIEADPFKFGGAAAKHGYDQRAACYMQGLYEITGRWHDYVLLAIEPEGSHESAMYRIEPGDDVHRAGYTKWRETLNGWAQCVKRDHYPGYGDDVMPLTMPKFAYPEHTLEIAGYDNRSNNNERNAGEETGSVVPGPADCRDEEAGVFGVSA